MCGKSIRDYPIGDSAVLFDHLSPRDARGSALPISGSLLEVFVKLRFAMAALAATTALVMGAPAAAIAAPASTQAAASYKVYVHTSNLEDAGTDATVQVKIHGANGSTGWLNLDNSEDNFERNDYDVFSFTLPDVGAIKSIDLSFNHGGDSAGWSLDYVSVSGGGDYGFFPYYNWLLTAKTIHIDAA
jgi:hypothetical protein